MIRAEIENLVGTYCDAVLRADVEVFASTWCDDAIWAISGRGEVVGRDEIVATFTSSQGRYRRCLQEVLNGVVTPAGTDAATAAWQVRELQWREDGTTSELLGVYHDTVWRTSEGWRFARRAFELVYDGPVELPGRLRSPMPPDAFR